MSDFEIDIAGTIFDIQRLSDDFCYLCGESLSTGGTLEHVFPKWLLRRHNLWNDELVLLNNTAIKYSQLTIPCCDNCNNVHLSGVENRVRTAIETGYEETVKLPNVVMYQ